MVDFSPVTVLASAAISVFVSSVVSLLLVPVVAVRQARAQRREAARQRLAAVVAPLLLDLQRYRAGETPSLTREPDTGHGDDADTAGHVLRAAADLGPVERRLVLRRSRIVFGARWVAQAALYPGEDESRQRFFGVMFHSLRENGVDLDVTSHLLHQAYVQPPAHRSQRALARHLWLLGHAW